MMEEFTASVRARKLGLNNIPGKLESSNLIKLCETILQPIRDRWARPLRITSGYRSPVLNRLVAGACNSQHLTGEAADIVSDDNNSLWKLIIHLIAEQEIEVGQLIDEKNLSWIHISLPNKAHKNEILKIK